MTLIRSRPRTSPVARSLAALVGASIVGASIVGASIVVASIVVVPAAAQQYPNILGSPNVTIDLGVLDALGPGFATSPAIRPVAPAAAGPAPGFPAAPLPQFAPIGPTAPAFASVVTLGVQGLLPPPAVAPRSSFNAQAQALLGLTPVTPQGGPATRRPVASLPERAPEQAPQAAPRQVVRVQPALPPAAPLPRRADAPAVPPPPRMPAPQVAAPVAPKPRAPVAEAAPMVAAPAPKPKAEPLVARAAPAPKVAAPAPDVPPVKTAPAAPRVAAPAPRVAAPPPPSRQVAAAPRPRAPEVAQPPRVAAPQQAAPQVAARPQQPAAPQVAARPPADEQPNRILFAGGSAQLPEKAQETLRRIAGELSAGEALRVQLLAYAQGTPETASQARRLSLSRALAVRSYLIDQGVRSTRMDVRALGNKVEGGPADRVDVVLVQR